MTQFVLELAAARDPDERRIAGIALDRRAAFGIEQAVDADHAVLWLAQVQVTPRMGAVGLGQRALRIDPVLEVLGHPEELTGVTGLRRLQQSALFLSHRRGPDVLGRPR